MVQEFTLNSVLSQMKMYVDMLHKNIQYEETKTATDEDLERLAVCLETSTESLKSILEQGKKLSLNPKLAKDVIKVTQKIIFPPDLGELEESTRQSIVALEAEKALKDFQRFVESFERRSMADPKKFRVEEAPEGQSM